MKKHHPQAPVLGSPPTGVKPLHEVIAVLAHELWIGHGRPENRAEAIWFEAEGRLAAAQAPPQRNPTLSIDS